jgi:hypothetical protein
MSTSISLFSLPPTTSVTLTRAALLGVKEMVAPSLIVVPLPFITLAFAAVAHSTFWPPMRTLSLMAAAERDARGGGAPPGAVDGVAVDGVADNYVSPSFKIE